MMKSQGFAGGSAVLEFLRAFYTFDHGLLCAKKNSRLLVMSFSTILKLLRGID